MRIAVLGAAGFIGSALLSVIGTDDEVIAIDVAGRTGAARPGATWHELRETAELPDLLRETTPDVLVHLAFQNRKPPSWSVEQYLHRATSDTVAACEACTASKVPVLLVGSSALYGESGGTRTVETDAVRPRSLYGAAKAVQETVAVYYASQLGMDLCVVRPFNVIGPGQARGMLIPDWIAAVREALAERRRELRVRTTRTSRDFVDVRDVANALYALARGFVTGETYNVCSGESTALGDVMEELKRLSGHPFTVVETESQPATGDVVWQCGSFDKLHARTGWQPSIGWKQSVRDAWNAWGTV